MTRGCQYKTKNDIMSMKFLNQVDTIIKITFDSDITKWGSLKITK